MSRNLKLLVFGGVFALLLVLFLIFGNKLGEAPDDTTPTQSLANLKDEVQLISVPQADIVTIKIEGDVNLTANLVDVTIEEQIKGEDGRYILQTSETKRWKSTDFDVNHLVIDAIANVGSALKSKRLISEKPTDPSVYGLDAPYRTITLVTADNRSFAVEIGSLTPTEDARYVRILGTEAVYTVEVYSIGSLTKEPSEFHNITLYTKIGYTEDNVTAITLYKNGEEVYAVSRGAGIQDWNMHYPIELKADYEDLWPVMKALAGVTFAGFEDLSPTDLKQYGLEQPKYQYNYTIDGKNYVLKIGMKKPESPYFYAMADGLPGVLLLSADSMSFIDKTATDYMYPFVFLPTIYDATKMIFTVDGRVDEMLMDVVSGDDGYEKITFNGRSLTTSGEISMAKKYYQGAIGFLFDTYDKDAVPTGKAAISVEYWLRNNPDIGNHMLVEFIPKPDGSGYYAMKNGVYTGLIVGNQKMGKSLESIREAYANFSAELAKTPAN